MPSIFLLQTLADGGQMYAETNLNQLIKEPWNATTAALFLIVVGYWAWRLRGRYVRFAFLSAIIPLLAIGGVGGTIYHAFRYHRAFLMMDYLPILLICLATSVYLSYLALGSWKMALLFVLSIFGLAWLNIALMPRSWAININYLLLAAAIIGPSLLILRLTRYFQARFFALAVFSFAVAITCRMVDQEGLLPMGTHFLWHSFGALACHLMIRYLFEIEKTQAIRQLHS